LLKKLDIGPRQAFIFPTSLWYIDNSPFCLLKELPILHIPSLKANTDLHVRTPWPWVKGVCRMVENAQAKEEELIEMAEELVKGQFWDGNDFFIVAQRLQATARISVTPWG
jgi:hypothetical protein